MALTSPPEALPRILLLIDKRGWAFDTIAHAIRRELSDRFAFDILATTDSPSIDASRYDLLHVFYFAEKYHLPFLSPSLKVIKSVYSFRWQLAGLTPEDLYQKHLSEAHAVSVPNCILASMLSTLPVPVFHTPEGIDTALFKSSPSRTGPIVFGFAGKTSDPVKQYSFVVSACERLGTLFTADGSLPHDAMPNFYRDIDVLVCASQAEGSPRPLLEAMACGKFPVTFPVGIAREVIEHGVNGLIVEDRTIAGLRTALHWCTDHSDFIRHASFQNIARMQGRDWGNVIQATTDMYASVLT